jgi:hypothetical protein
LQRDFRATIVNFSIFFLYFVFNMEKSFLIL